MTKSSVGWEPVRYCVDTDTMAVEVRPWPGRPGETAEGEDAGLDLVIHYYPGDGEPWLWEIEHASEHPEHIAAALREMRSRQSKPHTIKEVKFFGGGCKRNIEMTPLCNIEVTLPRVLGSREVRRGGGVVDEQAGVRPS